MPERVFVTGAGGFVGRAVVGELAARGRGVVALVRKPDARFAGEARPVVGDLFDAAALDDGMKGCDAVVHLVGIIKEVPSRGVTFDRIHREGTMRVLAAARRNGVRRFVHMSALGSRPDADSEYHKTKFRAEEAVRASGLDLTILRPSMIHGPGGEFMKMEAAWARGTAAPFVAMPYFGAGLLGLRRAGLLQPVYVGDVARAFADALDKPETIGQAYDLGGPERMSWPQLHAVASEAIVGRRRVSLPLPAWYAKALAAVVPRALLPFNRDQVVMSQEDNVCDLTAFVRAFGWEPRPFRQTLEAYAGELEGEAAQPNERRGALR